ncbi:two-component system histidine kinase, partial [Amycolatopsis vancoresmycina DSM 44592]
HGLRGMGERAAALGGRCTAGPVDGGFEVRVELPIEGEA